MSYGKPSEDFHLWTLEQPQTQEMVKFALDQGINFFDTANCYAHGTSEEYLGQSLKNLGVHVMKPFLTYWSAASSDYYY